MKLKYFVGKHVRKREIFGKYLLISGGPKDQNRAVLDIDRARITFGNLLKFKVKMGYSARDFMYYLKRCGNDRALLQRIDYEEDALTMIEDCIEEKTIRLAVSKTQED
jgi:hypothetical protein